MNDAPWEEEDTPLFPAIHQQELDSVDKPQGFSNLVTGNMDIDGYNVIEDEPWPPDKEPEKFPLEPEMIYNRGSNVELGSPAELDEKLQQCWTEIEGCLRILKELGDMRDNVE